jgi:hypothetical protein
VATTPPGRIVRRSPRHRLRLRVTTHRGSLFTLNVGPGGFCTELMRVLPVGAPLEGLIHLNGRDTSFTARVAWSVAGDSRLNQRGRMGVCFVQIDSDWARRLTSSGASGDGAGQQLGALQQDA